MPLFGRFFRLRRAAVVVASLALVVATTPLGTRAAVDKQLQRIRGVVGYQTADDAPFTQVAARFLLPDDYLAVTRANAAAYVALPDSSLVALGENTSVQVGAFNDAAASPGSSITLKGGSVRFDVKRPAGGAANYRFSTPTTQIAVRGTVGLLSLIGGNTTVACLVCAADSVSVTVGTQTFALAAGQVLTVSVAGAVVTSAVTSSVLGTFSSV